MINIIFDRAEISGCKVSIYDMRGRIIFSNQMHDSEKIIITENFPKGVYFIELKSETGIEIAKIVKM